MRTLFRVYAAIITLVINIIMAGLGTGVVYMIIHILGGDVLQHPYIYMWAAAYLTLCLCTGSNSDIADIVLEQELDKEDDE